MYGSWIKHSLLTALATNQFPANSFVSVLYIALFDGVWGWVCVSALRGYVVSALLTAAHQGSMVASYKNFPVPHLPCLGVHDI